MEIDELKPELPFGIKVLGAVALVVVALLLLSWVISTLKFLFWVAIIIGVLAGAFAIYNRFTGAAAD